MKTSIQLVVGIAFFLQSNMQAMVTSSTDIPVVDVDSKGPLLKMKRSPTACQCSALCKETLLNVWAKKNYDSLFIQAIKSFDLDNLKLYSYVESIMLQRFLQLTIADDYNALQYCVANAQQQPKLVYNFVNFLLWLGASDEVITKDGYDLLYLAIKAEHCDLVKLFLDRRFNGNKAYFPYKYTPLHLAVQMGNVAMVELLLSWPKIDIFAKDEKGQTALHHASFLPPTQKGAEDILILVLKACDENKKKQYINERDTDGKTPLMLACGRLNCFAVHYLLLAGADVHCIDDEYRTALHFAVGCDESYFERDTKEQDEEQVLTYRKTMLTELIEHGAKIMSDAYEQNPIEYAASFGYDDFALILSEVFSHQVPTTDETELKEFSTKS